MFQFDNNKSDVSTIAQSLLDNSGLFDKDGKGDSPTCVIYRQDPIHRYMFVAAHAGLRQCEPMYGPIVHDDQRRQQAVDQRRQKAVDQRRQKAVDQHRDEPNKLGFVNREGVEDNKHQEHRPGDPWQIWFNCRPGDKASFESFKKMLLRPLETLLESSATDKPLFPELWNEERRASERLHDEFRFLPPGASLERVGVSLTHLLQKIFNELSGEKKLHASVGIYLDTGSKWELLGINKVEGHLPDPISIGYDLNALEETEVESGTDKLSAFSWVHWSTRPVLLSEPLSDVWDQRLALCGPKFTEQFSGACIVPLLDLNDPSRSKGIVFLSSTASEARLRPAHVFLLSRIARDLAGFIVPLLPLPGYRWWPDIGLSRGNTKQVSWPAGRPKSLPSILPAEKKGTVDLWQNVANVERIVEELMPTGSTVTIRPLPSGLSGAQVFHIGVTDQHGINEIPRVLKIGDEAATSVELQAYYKFVHNKRPGVAARVDVARLNAAKSCPDGLGAVVYTLAGSGDEAVSWSEWALPTTDWKEFRL